MGYLGDADMKNSAYLLMTSTALSLKRSPTVRRCHSKVTGSIAAPPVFTRLFMLERDPSGVNRLGVARLA